MEVKPTNEQCGNVATLLDDKEEFKFACLHPQLGGYCSSAIVSFSKQTGCADGENGCFDVINFHDGKFPQEAVGMSLHYCDAMQLVKFGLLILDKQLDHQKKENGKSVDH